MDLLPTFCQLSNTKLPDDRIYDGYNISPLITGTGKSKRDIILYYRGERVYAIRKGNYKAHFITQLEYNDRTAHLIIDEHLAIENRPTILEQPLLYNVAEDPGERWNIAGEHPEIIAEIKKVLEEHQASIKPVENQLEK
jgi:hypothetical protein